MPKTRKDNVNTTDSMILERSKQREIIELLGLMPRDEGYNYKSQRSS